MSICTQESLVSLSLGPEGRKLCRKIHSDVLSAIYLRLHVSMQKDVQKYAHKMVFHTIWIFSGVALLGPVKQKFLQVSDVFEPCDAGDLSQLFISKTYDATSHFETACKDVLDVFRRGTGVEFDCSLVKHNLDQE